MTSDVWKQYLIEKPTDTREFRTLEIFHPDFTDLLRFVDDNVDQTLLLESDAPRNPGENVLFNAFSMTVNEPGEIPNNGAALTVNLGAIGNEVQDQIDQITDDGFLVPIEVIYRRFYEGDTTGPVLVFDLSAANLKFESYKSVAFSAQDINLAFRPVGEIYTLERFPGLTNV